MIYVHGPTSTSLHKQDTEPLQAPGVLCCGWPLTSRWWEQKKGEIPCNIKANFWRLQNSSVQQQVFFYIQIDVTQQKISTGVHYWKLRLRLTYKRKSKALNVQQIKNVIPKWRKYGGSIMLQAAMKMAKFHSLPRIPGYDGGINFKSITTDIFYTLYAAYASNPITILLPQ